MTKNILKVFLYLTFFPSITNAQTVRQQGNATDIELKRGFFQLCDSAAKQLNAAGCASLDTGKKKTPFYIDSYVVRALAAAYDMTGKEAYLEACRTWSDRMITFQEKMIPGDFYYMNYGRKPFETSGNCYSADNGCIAMAVLATAIRCKDRLEKQRYLNSVRSFTQVVLGHYIGAGGGVRNGFWNKFDGEWWCSSGTVGGLLFQLYGETNDSIYLKAGLQVIDWLNRQDLDTTGPMPLEEQGPSLPMYTFEAYAAGVPYIMKQPQIENGANKQINWLMAWASGYHFKDDGQWGSKYGGIPFHLLVQGRAMGDKNMLRLADRKLDEVLSLIFENHKPALSQFIAFSMLSMAEKISPGIIFRCSETSYNEGIKD